MHTNMIILGTIPIIPSTIMYSIQMVSGVIGINMDPKRFNKNEEFEFGSP